MKLYAKTKSLFAVSLLIAASAAYAQDGTVHLGTSEVSKEQVISILSPDSSMQPKTRGLRLHGDRPSESSVDEDVARALSLEVYFEFNSADLSPEAQQQLAPVGEALETNQLSQLDFTLEGHTDASGDENYNQYLSEQRANSVREFFVSNYDVPAERVSATGKGESELLEGISPNSGANRRVTIIAQ